jgi:hypothetical protein
MGDSANMSFMRKRDKWMVLVLLAAPFAHGQWINYPDPRTPRTKDGKPNLTAPAPRVRGTPDLSGFWQVESTSRSELSKLFPPGVGLLPGGENGLGEDDANRYFMNILSDYKPVQVPLTPAAAESLRKLFAGGGEKPSTLCSPPSVPVSELVPAPFKIVQTPGLTLILYEADSVFRQIYTDGRKHPVDPQPSWMGYSIGKWEGDWFVVDVMGFNDRSPLDAMGHQHSDKMRVTERFRRRDFGHMEIDITINDPPTFTKPVEIKVNYRLLADSDVIESFCSEGEQDLNHIPDH